MAKAAKTLTTKAAEERKAARELKSPRAARRRSGAPSSETTSLDVATTPEPATDAAAKSNKAPTGKLAILVAALSNEVGATIAELVAATGWQAHSVRGAISGSLKKKHGLIISSDKVDGVRRYRIVTPEVG